MIYQLALSLHLIGFLLLGGSTFFSFISFQKIFKKKNSDENILINSIISTAKLGFGLGMVLMAISGIVMISLASGYSSKLWFKIKMICLILFVANNFALDRPAMKKLNEGIQGSRAICQRLSIFYYTQLFFLRTIIMLSAYKFI